MFMLPFIFVIVRGLFEWKPISAGFFLIIIVCYCYLYCRCISNFQDRGSWDSINRFNPAPCLWKDLDFHQHMRAVISGEMCLFILLILIELLTIAV